MTRPSFIDRVIDAPLDQLVDALVAKGVPHNAAFRRVISLRHKGMVRRWRAEDSARAANPPPTVPIQWTAQGVRVAGALLAVDVDAVAYGRNWYRVRLLEGDWPAKHLIVRACDRFAGAPFGGVVELTGKPDAVRVAVYTD